jgi:hypothetical protein
MLQNSVTDDEKCVKQRGCSALIFTFCGDIFSQRNVIDFLNLHKKTLFFNTNHHQFLFKQCTVKAVQSDGSKLTLHTAYPYKSVDSILHHETPLLKNRSNAMGDLKFF